MVWRTLTREFDPVWRLISISAFVGMILAMIASTAGCGVLEVEPQIEAEVSPKVAAPIGVGNEVVDNSSTTETSTKTEGDGNSTVVVNLPLLEQGIPVEKQNWDWIKTVMIALGVGWVAPSPQGSLWMAWKWRKKGQAPNEVSESDIERIAAQLDRIHRLRSRPTK